MNKRRWRLAGVGLIVVGVGLLIWGEADPSTSTSAAIWKLVALLAYVLIWFAWAVVGVCLFVLSRFGTSRRPTDGPEADYHEPTAP